LRTAIEGATVRRPTAPTRRSQENPSLQRARAATVPSNKCTCRKAGFVETMNVNDIASLRALPAGRGRELQDVGHAPRRSAPDDPRCVGIPVGVRVRHPLLLEFETDATEIFEIAEVVVKPPAPPEAQAVDQV